MSFTDQVLGFTLAHPRIAQVILISAIAVPTVGIGYYLYRRSKK